jgi:4-hydroxythreonine-4-phosphate dehydrogenase
VKRIAVVMGDRYGVGPELVAGLLARGPLPADTALVVLGDRAVLDRGAASAGVTLAPPPLDRPEALTEGIGLVHRPADLPLAPLGRALPGSGAEMLDSWEVLIGWIAAGLVDGVVYAPLNKQAMAMAGHRAGDELEFLTARLAPAAPVGEINVLGDLWTSRVTSHVPLREVAGLITAASIGRAVRLIRDAQAGAGIAPRIAVAALNPHAGEAGLYGREEIEVIEPAIAALRAEGLPVEGPYPSDTVFPRARRDGLTAVVTMYHDQGQIALKLIGLGEGVTLLAGFAVPVATPGHGTAYDIAGKGIARRDGLAAAVALVRRLA